MLYPDAAKTSLEKIKQGYVFLPGGKLQPMSQLAHISVDAGSAEIDGAIRFFNNIKR